ncbi:5-methylcytosine rRNA methyltransferase NSUN4-like [Watersipora subatra]|uniref:5-methylcytosine rRNA methyltransferase NSUN4-like n=1 Tax=Watersipora subatra TaxID=2589382 RepID=UPI00355BBF10
MATSIVRGVGAAKLQYRLFHSSSLCCRYKKKWVEMGRKKVLPRELALSYFDTYYPKVYGEKCWEDSREAMLRKKKKYCALVNNFANAQQTMDNLMAEQQAFDMFSLSGDKLDVPYAVPLQRNDKEEEEDELAGMSIDMSDAMPSRQPVEYEQTPEGFVIPKVAEGEGEVPYYAPDLYDYVPAVRKITSKEELEQDMERQMLLLDTDPGIEISSAGHLTIPPKLRCHIHPIGQSQSFYSPKVDESKLLTYYLLDAASILPVIALELRPIDTVLDMCAAPGGKSLAIAQCLLADEIVCVDSSNSRLNRLKDTFRWYVPGSMDGMGPDGLNVKAIGGDALMVAQKHPSRFDKVLVDAPCNTDRQSLTDDENSKFKRTRVTERLRLPQLQTDILMAGITSSRPGGNIVYSTCTMTAGQNDHVVEAAITRLRETRPDIEVIVQDLSVMADKLGHVFRFWPGCRYGQLVLPVDEANFGPMYFSKLQRVQ